MFCKLPVREERPSCSSLENCWQFSPMIKLTCSRESGVSECEAHNKSHSLLNQHMEWMLTNMSKMMCIGAGA